ncbi:MAG: cbb3-type cytochrome c oxidase subunit II, partial [Limisphaerales bacterium]
SIAVKHPELRSLAGWTYPAGVSVYSACLVAFPAFGPITTRRAQIAWVGAVLYAVSGWICSGLGIGMAQNLNEIPWQFVVVSAGLISIPFLWKAGSRLSRREISYAAGVLAAAAIANMLLPQAKATAPSKVERGRAIYIAEGCINCHSQFVRPHSTDELFWGPYQPLERLTTNNPPLFGNRRQGPDLLNIGNRRSRAWLEFHFKAPRELSPGSSMPSYEHLFRDARGSALLDYLVSLKSDETRPVGDWRPDFDTVGRSDSGAVYQEHCAVCHGHSAAARPRFPAEFQRVPPDLFATNLTFAPTALPARVRVEQMARIIKFGLPGTDMPGHEYMPDQDMIALARYLEQRSRHQ